MEQITTPEQLDSVLEGGPALLYKHSTRCPISAAAHEQVEEFLRDDPHVPVYLVNVLDQTELSGRIAERTGVEHHSPQAILVADGAARWHASHYDVTADALRQQVRESGR
jgi:bacillithiol system protein YtxJ